MLFSIRRGPVALRSLRVASLPSSTLHARGSTKPFSIRLSTFQTSQISRPFSVFARYGQQVAEADLERDSSSQEFTKFEELGQAGVVNSTVIKTIVERMGIHTMTEVQKMTLNQCLDGEDVIAQARTGTGKTLAFLLPIIQRILRANPELETRTRGRKNPSIDIRGLIISPTRELAEQIAVEAQKLVANTAIRVQTAVGGTQKSYHLRNMQQDGCHLLIGTPGRVNDILADPRSGVSLNNIETFVLDEADRLLDIGFAPAIEEIQSHMPSREQVSRQTLMFSATVPKSVVNLVRQTMRPGFKFVRTVDPDEAPTHERVPQKVVFLNGLQNQSPTILEIAMNAIEAHKRDPVNNMPFKAIVYFSSTNEVDMAFHIFDNMRDPADPSVRGRFAPHPLSPTKLFRISGKLDQRVRTRESQGFRNAESAMLFSSDVTARGMDFPNVSHVIQLGLPRNADDYVHRIGRTGRAGKSGEGWLLLNNDERRAYGTRMAHPSLKLDELELATASLDMTQPAQLPSNVARMLQIVESGVKNVPYQTKKSVYQSLLGVLPQQFPGRQRQDQINMMNQLARYGWGMQTPPSLPEFLVRKLGYEHCQGIEYETSAGRLPGRDRDRNPQQRRQSNGFNARDPFGLGESGKGVFGGEQRNDTNRESFGGERRHDTSRGSFGGERRNDTNRGSFDHGRRGGRDSDRRPGGFSGRGRGSGGNYDRGSGRRNLFEG